MVLVTTKSGGVWVGEPVVCASISVEISRARLCLGGSVSLGEVMPLAYDGPGDRHLGEVMQWVQLYDVTAVICCTDRATEAWQERMAD